MNVHEAPDYCGCCGSEIEGADADWCMRCAQHVGSYGQPWDRTYLALHDTHCPFQYGRTNR